VALQAIDGRVTALVFGDLKPKKRWISTQAEREPARTFVRSSDQPAGTVLRPGFDGWKVSRSLCILEADGNTRTLALPEDHYEMVPKLVARGADKAGEAGKDSGEKP
jgi:hypothetical protein